jgi:hypothetical protein
MTSSITTTTSATVATTTSTAATTTSQGSTSGLSSVTTTMSSSAAAPGFFGQVGAWFTWVGDSCMGCLAKLPWIGQWFDKNPASTSSSSTSVGGSTSTSTLTDTDKLGIIRGALTLPSASTTSIVSVLPVPDAGLVNYMVGLFGQIGSGAVKAQAFEDVLKAFNGTDAIAKQFYDALAEGDGSLGVTKGSFRHHIWLQNGSSRTADGIDHGPNYGDHMVNTGIRLPVVILAAQNWRTALVNAAASLSSSTGSSGP